MIGTSATGQSFDMLDPSSVNWRAAIENACANLDAVSPVYLPIVDLKARAVRGYELLARFTGGPAAPPAMWFESAEKLGLTGPLERRIMRAGFIVADNLPAGCFLSINVTAQALLSDQVQDLFAGRERFDEIVLEVGEKDTQQPEVAEALAPFRASGGRLALDDIGAGFSNLHDVLALKPELLKVDRAIVRRLDRDRVRSAIVDGLARMASRLGIALVAEGIERREELAELERLEVPYGQGYLFGEPAASFTTHTA